MAALCELSNGLLRRQRPVHGRDARDLDGQAAGRGRHGVHGDPVLAIDAKGLCPLLKEDRSIGGEHRDIHRAFHQNLLQHVAHQTFTSTPQCQRGGGRSLLPCEVNHLATIVKHRSEHHVSWLGQLHQNGEIPSGSVQERHSLRVRCRQLGLWAQSGGVRGGRTHGGLDSLTDAAICVRRCRRSVRQRTSTACSPTTQPVSGPSFAQATSVL